MEKQVNAFRDDDPTHDVHLLLCCFSNGNKAQVEEYQRNDNWETRFSAAVISNSTAPKMVAKRKKNEQQSRKLACMVLYNRYEE